MGWNQQTNDIGTKWLWIGTNKHQQMRGRSATAHEPLEEPCFRMAALQVHYNREKHYLSGLGLEENLKLLIKSVLLNAFQNRRWGMGMKIGDTAPLQYVI